MHLFECDCADFIYSGIILQGLINFIIHIVECVSNVVFNFW